MSFSKGIVHKTSDMERSATLKVAVFFTELLDGFLEMSFLKKVHKKFHYGEEQFETLMAVAEEMLPVMCKEAFWERGTAHSYEGVQEDCDTVYEEILMSLGKGLDDLQEDYSQNGMLLESYMLETLAGELLLQAYSAYNRYVIMEGKWHVARYHFPGSEERFSLEKIPDILGMFGSQVICNEAFCMKPKKSVVFVAELTRDAQKQCEGICIGCGSVNCPNRVQEERVWGCMSPGIMDLPLNYGYRRIFGIF